MKVIEAHNVTFSYNAKEIIREVSLTLAQGEFLGIIGPNGAGKSTLLRLCARILKCQSGEILLFGKDINALNQKQIAEKIGFVPQETHFALNFSVEQIVSMGRYPYLKPFQPETRIDFEAVEQALQSTDLMELRKRPVNALSSGERQRVVIARALAQEPKILLLDEPTSHLDLNHQVKIMELLQKLNEQGKSIVIVNHDLNLASLYCQNLVLMHHGAIYGRGEPSALINEKILKDVYGAQVKIIRHPDRNIPQILLK